jgi:ATP-binding cassette subfamily F protein 3
MLENLSLGFPEKMLAKNVNLRIGFQDKIAVLGKNGCGKTTLLNLLNEELKPLSGKAKKGASLENGYYDQMHVRLEEKSTVKDTIWQLVPVAPIGYVLGYLARFGFIGDDVEKQITVLSGGEKARLYLAKLLHEKPNFLIMDEPTNHLDINMIDSLEEAFRHYDGTIVFVSHDRYFIEKIATKKFFFTHETIIETEKSLDELFGGKETKEKANKTEKPKSKKMNPYYLDKIHQEIEKIEREIEQINAQIADLEKLYLQPETFKSENKVKEIQENISYFQDEKKNLQQELDEKEHAYLELMESDGDV